ncbi:glycosyltransferase [Coraliomargarita sp. SDUM461004]|uniref:Glycosyltransferase n=1 Tax=Thalassobacterium sedimentorum TaxID=3041258 RepID=A0ABU1AGF5_9BACT|nr:nucleotide disphospho-sugar-binding domain-containing protein [Coraliomargarita sp. SDUM461004]MDQ8192846.1 glycosyltransferase [Coraliomargarita sp. SDUM461004]
MNVLLTSHGSTGDIYPVIRLGRALVEAGHEVRFATVSLFRDEIESAGIEFVYLPPDWDQSGFAEAMRDLTKARHALDLIRIIYSESLPFLDEILETLQRELVSADIFVTSYVFANLCTLARQANVPCVVTTFAHNVVPSVSYPPEGLPRLAAPAFLRRRWNQVLWKLTDRVLCWQINRVVGEAMARHGMGRAESFALEPADLALVTVSAKLCQPPRLWSDRFKFTGYLRWQSPEDAALEDTLKNFCQNEAVPILTFGSVTFDEARKVMTRFMRNWPAGKKIIIQSGWAGLTIERPNDQMLRVGRVSHDQLFRYASLVIHHGGAGTTASVLHAGVPHVIIPHIGDQWFFASEVKRLGVGLEVKRKRWPEDLPKAVRMIEKSKKMPQRARDLAVELAKEDGPAAAVHALEQLLRG